MVLPLAAVLGALWAVGWLTGASALVAAAATLIFAMLVAIPFAASLAAARRAIERLSEPDGAGRAPPRDAVCRARALAGSDAAARGA